MNSASKSTFIPKKSTTFGDCCWQYICEENFDPLFDPYFALRSHLATCFNSAAANKNTKKCFGNNQSNMHNVLSVSPGIGDFRENGAARSEEIDTHCDMDTTTSDSENGSSST